jgi:hypothetical protein
MDNIDLICIVAVAVLRYADLKSFAVSCQLRSIFVVVMNGLRDIETQKRGWVTIAYNVGRIHSTGE